MNYLVSYNHSGNTLVRYFIELLTGRPTIGHNLSSISDRFNLNILNVDSNECPILIKRHELEDGEIKEEDKFILILRDHKDCIKNNYESEIDKYFKLINGYTNHKGEKIIITYDEIISDILKVSKVILDFIGIDGINYDDIDVDFHKNNCLSVYRNSIGVSGCDESKINRIPSVHFTYDLWRAGSLIELGVRNREWSIKENRNLIKKMAVGYTEGRKLQVRIKPDCMAVMFFIKNNHFWTHLTKKEFLICFSEK